MASRSASQGAEETSSLVESNFESDANNGRASSLQSVTQTPLPLTTIYTPPASCSSLVTWDGTSLWQYGVNQTGGDCYPPDFLSIYNSFYTPGICPDQWTSAGVVKHSTGSDAMCCPKGYFLSAHKGYGCASIASGIIRNIYSTFKVGNDPIPSGVPLTTLNANGGATTVNADVIQVQWQKKDQQIIRLMSSRTASRSGSGPTPQPGSHSPSTPSATRAPQQTGSSGGLSTGAKVGIGVAVPLVVLALIGIGLFIFFRRRKSRASNDDAEKTYAELAHNDQHAQQQNGHAYAKSQAPPPPQEMDAAQFNELPADGPVPEIEGNEMQRTNSFKNSDVRDSEYVEDNALRDSQFKDRGLEDQALTRLRRNGY